MACRPGSIRFEVRDWLNVPCAQSQGYGTYSNVTVRFLSISVDRPTIQMQQDDNVKAPKANGAASLDKTAPCGIIRGIRPAECVPSTGCPFEMPVRGRSTLWRGHMCGRGGLWLQCHHPTLLCTAILPTLALSAQVFAGSCGPAFRIHVGICKTDQDRRKNFPPYLYMQGCESWGGGGGGNPKPG